MLQKVGQAWAAHLEHCWVPGGHSQVKQGAPRGAAGVQGSGRLSRTAARHQSTVRLTPACMHLWGRRLKQSAAGRVLWRSELMQPLDP